jgi:hypothetical protein
MKVSDLVMLKNQDLAYKLGLGLIMEIPYGVPDCAKVLWVESGRYKSVMKSQLAMINESR